MSFFEELLIFLIFIYFIFLYIFNFWKNILHAVMFIIIIIFMSLDMGMIEGCSLFVRGSLVPNGSPPTRCVQ